MKLITSTLKIENHKIFEDFKKHFNIPDNDKILFSGKYGIGKTYFLEEFFRNSEITENYISITISPVHYVVSSNEDIFELIKVDIIKNLFLNKQLEFIDGDISLSKLDVLKEYFKGNPLSIVKQLASSLIKVGAIGETAKKSSEVILEMLKNFAEFEKKLNETIKPKANSAKEFGDNMYDKIGSFLEFNFISEIIKESLINSKLKNNKKNILIIEDFDRLDPEHIFRILNIFSAHHIDESSNKFGFDKILIICDLNNIKSLYKHRYGKFVDFNGYIDKFYSVQPYDFDNKKAIYTFLRSKFKLLLPDYAINVLVYFICMLIEKNKITLRKLMKINFLDFDINTILKSFTWEDLHIHPHVAFPVHVDHSLKMMTLFYKDVPLLTVLAYLQTILGGSSGLKGFLKSAKNMSVGLEKSLSLDFAKLLIIPTKLISKTPDDHLRIFFSDRQGLSYPVYQLGNISLRNSVKFFKGGKYTGEGSFFDESSFVLMDDNFLPLNLSMVCGIVESFNVIAKEEEWIR